MILIKKNILKEILRLLENLILLRKNSLTWKALLGFQF